MIHTLKTWTKEFNDVLNEHKKFEWRKNDRDYKPGDILIMKEFVPEFTETDEFIGGGEYTEKIIIVKVTYILYGGSFNIPKDYCIMGIELMK